MKRLLAFLIYSVFASVMSVMAAAEESESGRIKGAVKDSNGAVVSGIDVTLLLPNQAVARATVTDGDGSFTFDDVPPGTYGLNIERAGFVRHRSAVQITSGETRELNIVLEVNTLAENVTITAEAGLVVDTRKVATQINLIPEQEIFERAPEVVAQVVDEEPGVNLQRTSPSLSAVFVHGLTGRNVAVFVDGVRYTTSAQRGGVGTFFSPRSDDSGLQLPNGSGPRGDDSGLQLRNGSAAGCEARLRLAVAK